MSSGIEKEVLRKIEDVGFTVPNVPALRECSEEDLNALFISLVTVYDESWTIDALKGTSYVRKILLRYLRLLELGYLITSPDSIKPKNPAMLRCLSALTDKLIEKYGNRLQLRVRQALKSNPSTTSNRKVEKNKPAIVSEPLTPPRVPKTPTGLSRSAVKLLNGCPVVPGSELRGWEIPRSPPATDAVTPYLTHRATTRGDAPAPSSPQELRTPSNTSMTCTSLVKSAVKLLSGSPLVPGSELQGWQIPRSPPVASAVTPVVRPGSTKKSQSVRCSAKKRAATHSRDPSMEAAGPVRGPSRGKKDCLAPETSSNVIPSGKQLGRTPPGALRQTPGQASKDSKNRNSVAGTLASTHRQSQQVDPVAVLLDFEEGGAEEEGALENRRPCNDDVATTTNCCMAGDDSIVLPASQDKSTPVALTCPEDLQCTENDRQFLQLQENLARIRRLEKEANHLTKQIGDFAYKKDLLLAEVKEVTEDVDQVGEDVGTAWLEIRRALSGQTPASPSTLPRSAKQTLLAASSHQMAARARRLQTLLHRERQPLEPAGLDATRQLEEERDCLEAEVRRRLPEEAGRLEQQLGSARRRLGELREREEGGGVWPAGCPDRQARRARSRLRVLRDRVAIATRTRAVMKKMCRQ